MIASTPTVRDLFMSSEHGGRPAGLRLPPVPSHLSSLVTGFEWKGLAERFLDLLDINVVDILIGGWKRHEEVRAQLAASAADPSKSVLVNLGSHTITSTHASAIQVRSGGRTLMDLSVPMELTFEVEAVELTLGAGRVRQIRTGKVQVQGTVKIEEATVLTRDLATIKLPGTIQLDASAPASVHAHESTAAAV